MDIDLVEFVIAGLQQDRNVELGPVDQFGHGNLVAEIGQADHQAVDLVAIGLEVFGIELGIRNRLHGAIGRRLEGEGDGLDPERVELRQNLVARLPAGRGAEERPASDDNTQ